VGGIGKYQSKIGLTQRRKDAEKIWNSTVLRLSTFA
jgi:hypothetical protein